MFKNIKLVEILEKNYDITKTRFTDVEEIKIISIMDRYAIEKILHKNIIELYLMLEKGPDAKLKF